MNIFGWFLAPELKEYMDEHHQSIDFYGNKVFSMKQEKDSNWLKAYKALAKSFYDFIMSHKLQVTKWIGSDNAQKLWLK